MKQIKIIAMKKISKVLVNKKDSNWITSASQCVQQTQSNQNLSNEAIANLSAQWPNYIAGGNGSDNQFTFTKVIEKYQKPNYLNGKNSRLLAPLRTNRGSLK